MYLITFVFNKHSGKFPLSIAFTISKDLCVKCNYKYTSGVENVYNVI